MDQKSTPIQNCQKYGDYISFFVPLSARTQKVQRTFGLICPRFSLQPIQWWPFGSPGGPRARCGRPDNGFVHSHCTRAFGAEALPMPLGKRHPKVIHVCSILPSGNFHSFCSMFSSSLSINCQFWVLQYLHKLSISFHFQFFNSIIWMVNVGENMDILWWCFKNGNLTCLLATSEKMKIWHMI